MHPRPTLAAACLSSLLSLSGLAAAEDRAEALFNQGVDLMEAGHPDQGCPLIEQSLKVDPRPGTLFALAECEAQRGRLATAVARYDEYLALFASLSPDKQAKQRDREKTARAQKAAIGPEVPELTLVLPKDAPVGTVVKRDGEVLGTELGVPIPVDPGDHRVTTQAADGPVTEIRVKLAKGEKRRVELRVSGPVEAPALPPPEVPPPSRDGPSGRRVGVYIAGGAGLAGLIVGAITGGLAIGRKGVVDDNCVDAACNAKGKAAADSLKTFGLVSTIGFGVGIAGLGAAAVLFFTDPARRKGVSMRRAPGLWVSAEISPIGAGFRGGW